MLQEKERVQWCTLAVQSLHVALQSPPLLADAVGELLPSVLTRLVQGFPTGVPSHLLLLVREGLRTVPQRQIMKVNGFFPACPPVEQLRVFTCSRLSSAMAPLEGFLGLRMDTISFFICWSTWFSSTFSSIRAL